MMSYEESQRLPIPEEYKNTPNIYRLACMLESTGRPLQIIRAMDSLFTAAGNKASHKKDGAA